MERNLEQKLKQLLVEENNRLKRWGLIEEMICDFCTCFKTHNPQYKNCASCEQIEEYRDRLESEVKNE